MRQKPAEGANIHSISSTSSAEQLELGKYYKLVMDESQRSNNSLRFLLRFHFFHTPTLTLQKPLSEPTGLVSQQVSSCSPLFALSLFRRLPWSCSRFPPVQVSPSCHLCLFKYRYRSCNKAELNSKPKLQHWAKSQD